MLAGEQEFFCNRGWKSHTAEVHVVLSWSDEQHTLLLFPRLLAVLAPVFDAMMPLLEKTSGFKSGRKALGEVSSAGSRLLVLFCSGHSWLGVLMLEGSSLRLAVGVQTS